MRSIFSTSILADEKCEPGFLAAMISVTLRLTAAKPFRRSYNRSLNNLQYGFSIKGTLFLDLRQHVPAPYFRVGADAGIASAFIDNWLYPAVNLELQCYNGGLGTPNRDGQNYRADFEVLPAFTLTAGWPNRLMGMPKDNRYVGLYYFSDFARPALQNPYDYSFSIGTLWSIIYRYGQKDAAHRVPGP